MGQSVPRCGAPRVPNLQNNTEAGADTRWALLQIGDQALVVIEDIDTVELPNRMAEEASR